MKTRRSNYSDDPLIISRSHTRAKQTSVIETTEDSIPIDIILEILSRSSAKSVGKCRCVSKLWASMLRRPDFTELFLTRSRSRPQLLLFIEKDGKYLLFSAPQPQNSGVNSSPVCTNRLMHFPFYDRACEIIGPVLGLVCFRDRHRLKGRRKETVLMICNPSTKQSLFLPKVKTKRVGVACYFMYDPIDKQFKVLCMTYVHTYGRKNVCEEYQILTIETDKEMSWRRMIKCYIPPHYAYGKGICINGVLYYPASEDSSSANSMMVCFDVRSEMFSLITIAKDSAREVSGGNLINYNGKLGSLSFGTCNIVGGIGSFNLWVLEDAEKKEWSKRTFVLPVMWQDILGIDRLKYVGVTRRNEIIFSSFGCMPLYFVYYNIEKNTITKVGIQGMEAFENTTVHYYVDLVEDVKLI